MNYTSEQKEAITTTNTNLVVTAGAGAGKTRVLVDRILHILKNKLATIEEIVAITYTNKAAMEIKDRLRNQMEKQRENEDLIEMRQKLGISYIGTIHSFCLRILQENPVEVDIDPDVVVIEEYRSKVLLKESVREVILRKLNEDDTFNLTSELGFEGLLKEVLGIIEKMRNQGLSPGVFEQRSISDDERTVVTLIKEALTVFDQYKESLGCLDFEDILQKTLELFSQHPEILQIYQGKFKFIMVDEYQDLNFAQNKILRLLGQGPNFFVVGDKKQSIFGFRGARVELFEELKQDLQNEGKALNLKDNFRSEKNIIEFVNQSFDKLMENYEEIEAHRCLEPMTNLHFLIPEGQGLMTERREYEGQLIAQKILAMMQDEDTKVFDQELKQFRKPKFKDFAVLLRKRTHIMNYIKAFEAHGIPFYITESGGLVEGEGVKALLNALETIEFKDEISLYGTLSALFGMEDEILAYYVLTRGKLLSALEMDGKEDLFPSGFEELDEAFKTIRYWAIHKDRLTLHELSSKIIAQTQLDKFAQVRDPLGVRNLFRFLDLCTEYDELGYTLGDFLLEVSDFSEDYKEATDTLEDEDVVRFTTIHSSKGLEFPIVILADSAQDISVSLPNILFEPDLGIALKKDKEKWDEIKQSLLNKEIEEAKRLLYVALTRARDHLVISGELKKSKKDSFIQWLLPQIDELWRGKGCTSINAIKVPGDIHISHRNISQKPRQSLRFQENRTAVRRSYATSLLGEFLRCPMCYYYKNVMGVPEETFSRGNSTLPGLSAVERGSLVHEIIEKTCSGILERQKIGEFIKTRSGIMVEEDMLHIERCLSNYFRSDYCNAKGRLYPELPFTYCLKDRCYITGIIDLLRTDVDEAEIVDFKTNKKIDQSLIGAYTLQVQTYVLAMTEIANIPVKRAVLASLYEGRIVDVDISPGALATCKNKLLAMISDIENNNFSKVDLKIPCGHCGYNGVLCK